MVNSKRETNEILNSWDLEGQASCGCTRTLESRLVQSTFSPKQKTFSKPSDSISCTLGDLNAALPFKRHFSVIQVGYILLSLFSSTDFWKKYLSVPDIGISNHSVKQTKTPGEQKGL